MYVPPENSIWIPLGIQMPPFFENDRIQALNYGGIGSVLGHELTHGFDNNGALFDDKGNFENWWSKSTREKFEKKQQCFINQYGNISFEALKKIIPDYDGPMNVSGTNTLGENIAGNK
jgi:predicted metalloendopeptidase